MNAKDALAAIKVKGTRKDKGDTKEDQKGKKKDKNDYSSSQDNVNPRKKNLEGW